MNNALKIITLFIITLTIKPTFVQAGFPIHTAVYKFVNDTDTLQHSDDLYAQKAKRTANAFGWISVITCVAFIAAVTVAIVIASDSWGIAAGILALISLMAGAESYWKDNSNKKAWAGLSIGIVIAAPLMALWLLPYKIDEGCKKRKARKLARKNRS